MNRIKADDHKTYERYINDPDKEPFQKYFIKWFESGGVPEVDYKRRLQRLLQDLRYAGHEFDKIASHTQLVQPDTLSNHRWSPMISEEKCKKIYYHLKEVFK